MKINERNLVEGLSFALDVAEKSHFSHAKHVAYIAIKIAKKLKLSKEEQKDLYFIALLHDIGANQPYAIETHNADLVAGHCEVGRDFILELPIKKELAECIYYHHEYYDGAGPFGKVGKEIPLFSQIICLSNAFELRFGSTVTFDFSVMEEIINWIDLNRKHYAPEIIEVFEKLIKKETVLLDYFSYDFNEVIKNKINVIGDELGDEEITAYAHVLSKIIDNRSSFTYRHSIQIAEIVSKVCESLGYDKETTSKVHVAALLHDIGKLAISNDIIEKPSKLDSFERFEINKHSYYTRWILKQIDGVDDVAEYASNHHEKLNGKGYPRQLKAHQIGEPDRIITICDIYQALTEERPYKEKIPIEKVWSIIDSMVDNGELDGELVEKIKVILA